MEVPFAQAVVRRRRGRGRRRGDRLGLADPGPAGRGVRAGLRRARRRAGRGRDDELHDRAPPRPLRLRRRARRRGDRPVALVHRDRERGLAVRGDAGLRRHRPAHLQPRSRGRRAAPDVADQGGDAGPPGRPAGRHGRASSSSPSATAWLWSRTPPARSAPCTGAGRSARSARSPASRSTPAR